MRTRRCRLYLESDEEYTHIWCVSCEAADIPYVPDMTQCPYCGSDKIVPYHEEDAPRTSVWG